MDELDSMHFIEEENVEKYYNPCTTSFSVWRKEMTMITEHIYKQVLKRPAASAVPIDLKRMKITYHRNLYMEKSDAPFDSTYLNHRPDVVCMPTDNQTYLDGILEALSTMKAMEHSLFIISYHKMFKELGIMPRIAPKADILCDLKILKVEEIGDEEANRQFMNIENEIKKFSDVKTNAMEVLLRAKELFKIGNFESSIKKYQKIIQTVEIAETVNDAEKKEKLNVLQRAHINMAISFVKVDKYRRAVDAIQSLERICSIDNQPKALYTKGKALMILGEYDGAAAAMKRALLLLPADKTLLETVNQLIRRKESYEIESKKFAKLSLRC